MPTGRDHNDRYLLSTVDKALCVLELLERERKPLNIQEVAAATGIQRVAVFRLLCTLERRGYVERLENKRYRCTYRRRSILMGYAAPLTGTPFRRDVAASLRRAAADAHVELLLLDNAEDDPETCLKHAQAMIDAKVDLAMAFQPIEPIDHTVADCFFNAGIPFISIEKPIQGAVYFGANNYQAGKLAGRVLGRFAREHWRGKFEQLVLLESSATSAAMRARAAGVRIGLQEVVGAVEDSHVIHLDGRAHEKTSREAMAELLRHVRKGARLLVSGFNDPSAVGALEAVRAAGREQDVAIVGQNATEESREEIRSPHSRLIASVAYFPERYGNKLLRLALAILNREPVPPAVYTEHVVLEQQNIDRYYAAPRRG
jgi:ribose transport system substrate-binding protein